MNLATESTISCYSNRVETCERYDIKDKLQSPQRNKGFNVEGKSQ